VWSAGKTGRLQGGLSPRAEPLLTHSNQHLKPTWPAVIVCGDLMHGGRDSCLFVVAERMHECVVIVVKTSCNMVVIVARSWWLNACMNVW